MSATKCIIYVTLAPIISTRELTPIISTSELTPITEIFKGICDEDNGFKANCNVRRKTMNDLLISKQIAGGTYGKIYLGHRGVERYIIKHTRFYQSEYDDVKGVRFDREICNQHLASEHNIAPKILTYWKCDNKNEGIIIMDYIEGITLYEYIKMRNTNVIEVYLNILKKVLYQSLVLNIWHGDLHYGNIIVTNNDIFIIDYGKSEILTINIEERVINKILPYVYDWINYTNNTINYVYDLNKHTMDDKIRKLVYSGLHKRSTWDNILIDLYTKYNRVPTYMEIYDKIANILS